MPKLNRSTAAVCAATFTVVFASQAAIAGISWNNEVATLSASSKSSSNAHFVTWKHEADDFSEKVCQERRTRFSAEDRAILNLLTAAMLARKKVSFYFDVGTDLDRIPGHGVGRCVLRSVWIDN